MVAPGVSSIIFAVEHVPCVFCFRVFVSVKYVKKIG